MKKNISILIIIFITSFVNHDNELKLILKSSQNEIFLGESFYLTLSIDGIKKEIENENRDTLFSSDKFNYTFSITPNKSGKIKLGPYKIQIADKTLISNDLLLNVLDMTADNKVIISIPEKLSLNNKYKLSLIHFKNELKSIELKDNSSIYKKGGKSSSSNTSIINSKTQSKYITTYEVTFVKAGKFIIDDSFFKNIPDNLQIAPKSIIVQ